MVGYELETLVGDAHALADVQSLQLVHLPDHPVDAVVADVARAKRQGLELIETLGDVRQALVAHFIAKRHVQPVQPQSAHGKMHDARVADVIARPQVQSPQLGHVRQVDHPRVRDAAAKAQVQDLQLVQALGDVLERQVRQLLTVLQGQVLQAEAALRGAAGHAGQVPDAHVGHVPAAPQVQAFELVEAPGDEQQPRVGDVTTPAEIQQFQVFQILRDPAQAGIGDLFAKAEVEYSQRADVLHESMTETVVR